MNVITRIIDTIRPDHYPSVDPDVASLLNIMLVWCLLGIVAIGILTIAPLFPKAKEKS